MLADELVAGREVEDKVGTRQCQTVAGRRGSPHILADLDTEQHIVAGAEELCIRVDGDGVAGEADLGGPQVLSRRKPALLVKLAVVGEVRLRHESQQLALLNDGRTVEQQVAHHHGESHDGDDVQLAGEVEERHYRSLCSVEQHILCKQVLTGVAGKAQFREDDDLHALAFSLHDEVLNLLYVVLRVGHAHHGHSCSHFDKSVFHINYFIINYQYYPLADFTKT